MTNTNHEAHYAVSSSLRLLRHIWAQTPITIGHLFYSTLSLRPRSVTEQPELRHVTASVKGSKITVYLSMGIKSMLIKTAYL